MAIHEELNPDDAALPFMAARANRLLGTDNAARTAGVIVVPNRDGSDTVLGVNGVAPWVGDTTPPGKPLDIEATSHLGTALIRWGGELEGGIPSDFRCVQIWAKQVGATADEKTLVGVLSSAGEVNTGVFAAGTTLDVWATALDNAHDRDGSPAFNESVESEHVQVEILPIVSQQEFDEAADNILAAADESVKAQIDKVNTTITEAQQAIEANREGLEQEAYLRAEADKAARETSDAIKTETDKLKGDYADMATDVASVKQDMLDTVSRVESVEGTQEQQAKDIEKATGTANAAKGTAESAERTANAAKQLATDNAAKTITGSVIEYAVGGATAAPTSGWTTGNVTRPAGATVWMRTRITYGDGRTTVTGATPVTGDTGPMGQQGPQGATGATGVSVTALTTYYVLAVSKPAKPAGKNPEGAWSTVEPALDRASNLYTTTRVDYSDGQWAWTDVTQSGAYKMAQAAQNSAEDAARLAQNADTLSQTTAGEVDRLDKAHTITAATANSAAQAAASAQALLNVLSAQTQELLYNGGFESGDEQDDGWVAGVGSKPHRQQSPYSRSGSYRAYLNTDASIASRELISQHPIPVTVGARYRFQYWYKLVSAGAATAGGPRLQKSTDGINWSDCPNCPNTSLIEVQTWTRQTMDYVVEDGVKYIRARIAFNQPVNAYFDDASITDVTLVYEAEQQAEQATKLARKLETDLANSNARLEAAEAAVIGAQTTADSKNKRFVQPTEPTYDLLKPGDEWWQTSSKPLETYWMGEPNNSVSVLVDHSGEVEHIWTWNGTRWADLTLAADSLFVRGTVSAGLVSADFFDGAVVKGGAFLTSNERIQLNNNGFSMVDALGNPVVTLDAKTGEAILQSVNLIGAGLSTPAISGGSIEGADYKLTTGSGADKHTVARLNSDGVVFGDHLSYAKNTQGQWVLSIKGAIQSGGTISGATVVGGIIRTNTEWQSSEAAKKYRGLVITDGGMFAYKNNGKEEYSMTFTAATGELKLDGAISTNAVFNAPTISAGEMVGTNIYTSTDADNRVSITSAGLTVTHGGHTVISFAADGAVDLGTSGIAADSRVSDLTDEVHDSYTPLATFTQTTDALGESVTNVQTQVGATADRLDEEIDARKQYMQFDPNNGLTIGDLTNADAYSVQLTSTMMQFRAGNTVAAYVSNDRLYINNAEVVNTLRIGNFAFLPRDNGHMSLQYVGGSATVQEV
ncbi:hypothetical protein [Bifidobacterium pseudolongum]|uniref:hypothetical protein n=1 Tax=Bifidobacterium pseudolongum TaxID=1694 RepID=UPI00263F84D1|nr:hypothetical protein [Bifidobacterium pseudolongum]